MKKIIFAIVAALSLSIAAANVFAAPNKDVKMLHFKYNDRVLITITNIACPLKTIKADYPLAVVASRSDGQHLLGCFKKKDENYLEIQWNGGDKSIFPANAFLEDALKDVDQTPKEETAI